MTNLHTKLNKVILSINSTYYLFRVKSNPWRLQSRFSSPKADVDQEDVSVTWKV